MMSFLNKVAFQTSALIHSIYFNIQTKYSIFVKADV
jgi:hypothetical protein